MPRRITVRNLTLGGVQFKAQLSNGMLVGEIPLALVRFGKYQRGLLKKHVLDIASNWDAEFARLLACAWWNNEFWCYDGLQTLSAALRRGITHLPATVIYGGGAEQRIPDPQRQCKMFFVANDAPQRMNGWKKFESAFLAGDQTVIDLLDDAAYFHLTTPLSPGRPKTKDADIVSVGVLREPFDRGGFYLLDKVLTILDEAWREGGQRPGPVKAAAKSIDLIRGLTKWLVTHAEVPIEVIVENLSMIEPGRIRKLANQMDSGGRIDAAQFTQAFEQVMNVAVSRIRWAV